MQIVVYIYIKGKQTIYTHTHGNGKQVETIRVGQTIRPEGNTRGRSKLPETREELNVKIKQEATRQHRLKTKSKHNVTS